MRVRYADNITKEAAAGSRPGSGGTGGRRFEINLCGCGAMEGPCLVKSLWDKLWNYAKKKRVITPELREPLIRSE
jgi:hypothetical protein